LAAITLPELATLTPQDRPGHFETIHPAFQFEIINFARKSNSSLTDFLGPFHFETSEGGLKSYLFENT
jgi:hypothetical protein